MVALHESKEWLVWTPDGRYDGSTGCEKFVAYRVPGTLDLSPTEALRKEKRSPGLLKRVLEGWK